MKNIFIGFLLIFLDFNLNINTSTIGLLPDFVGYIILIKGLDEVASESSIFLKARPWAVGMSVYSAILYVLDLLGASSGLGFISILLGIISTIISLYISYVIVTGVRDIESVRGTKLNGEKLRNIWNIMAIFKLVSYIAFMSQLLALICIIISFIISIFFLVAFNTTKKLFEGLPPKTNEVS